MYFVGSNKGANLKNDSTDFSTLFASSTFIIKTLSFSLSLNFTFFKLYF